MQPSPRNLLPFDLVRTERPSARSDANTVQRRPLAEAPIGIVVAPAEQRREADQRPRRASGPDEIVTCRQQPCVPVAVERIDRRPRSAGLLGCLIVLAILASTELSGDANAQQRSPQEEQPISTEELPLPPVIPGPRNQNAEPTGNPPALTQPPLQLSNPLDGLQEYLESSRRRDQDQMERLQKLLIRLEQAMEAQRAAVRRLESRQAKTPTDETSHDASGEDDFMDLPGAPSRPMPPGAASEAPSGNTGASGTPSLAPNPLQPGAENLDPALLDPAEIPVQAPVESTSPQQGSPSTVAVSTNLSPIPITDRAIDRAALADNLFAAGRIEVALPIYQDLAQLAGDEKSRVWFEYQLASCHRALGDIMQATKYYRRVAGSKAQSQVAESARWWLARLHKQQELSRKLKAIQDALSQIEQDLP